MSDTYISFYLRNYRIHLFMDILRGIGSPRFIQFLVDPDGRTLAIAPTEKKGFKSHRIPPVAYTGKRSVEINSMGLCKLIAAQYGWDTNCSYRVPGIVSTEQKAAIFELGKASVINSSDTL
ncbi:MAG: hypothetical protein E7298_14345 [Lachnospiraceae bacterium]|nr:hypothetical protein [Lachnospiraceae bacterium]